MLIRDKAERTRRRREVRITVHHVVGGGAIVCFLAIPILGLIHSWQAFACSIGVVASAFAHNHAESALQARRQREGETS